MSAGPRVTSLTVVPFNAARRLHSVHDADMRDFTGFTSWLRANNCGDNTVTDRVGVLKDFARTYPRFPNVTPAEITAWLGRPGYAQWTRATYFGHLRSFFTWAVQTGVLVVDPMLGMRRPKHGRCVPRPLTPAQVAAVRGSAGVNVGDWLTLGLFAGLRAFEIAKIRGEDVEERQLYVVGKGGSEAYLPTHPLVWALALERPTAGWWFPTIANTGHVSARSVSAITGRVFARNGIEGSVHRGRHTYATELLRAGVNIRVVQTLMRHASLQSTMVYTAVDEDERRDAIRLLVAA